MNDLIIKVSKRSRLIDLDHSTLGIVGENLQEKLIFTFQDEFVDGLARLEYELDNEKHYVLMEKVGQSYILPVQNVLLTKEGNIDLQLVITEDKTGTPVFKSEVFTLYCKKSIEAVGEAPSSYELWIEKANRILLEASRVNIDGKKTGNETIITITQKDGNKKSFPILDGQDGQDGEQGPQGPVGPQGPQGPAGPQGPVGPTPDLSNYVQKPEFNESQAEQDTTTRELQAELDRYKLLENALPHTENATPSDYVTLENTAKSPMEIETIPQTSQETTTGAQVYDINNDDISVNPDFVIDSDDWISLTFNNTGESAVFYNFYKTIPKIKNDTNYNVIVEIANVSGTGDFYVISAGGSSVFTNGYILSLNNTSSNTIYNEIRTTKSDAETSGSLGMRTFVRARTGESGSIKFRLSLLEDTTITPSTFVYQKYTGTLPSPNPDYPEDIHCTTGENTVKVVGKNLFDEQTEVGKIYITTGTNQSSSINLRSKNFTPIKPSTNYYLYNGYFVGSPSSRILVFFYDKNYQFLHTTNASNVSFTSPSNAYYLRFYCNDSYGTTYRNDICLEESSTAITYVAHEETTYPISLGNKEMYNINGVYDGFVYDETEDKFYFRRWNRKIELPIADMNNSENYPGWKNQTQVKNDFNVTTSNVNITGLSNIKSGSNIAVISTGSDLYLSRSVYGNDYTQTYWKTNYPDLVFKLFYNLRNYIEEEITDVTLISQLRAIKNALSMQGTTHIISTSSGTNLPFLIKARAVQTIERT